MLISAAISYLPCKHSSSAHVLFGLDAVPLGDTQTAWFGESCPYVDGTDFL